MAYPTYSNPYDLSSGDYQALLAALNAQAMGAAAPQGMGYFGMGGMPPTIPQPNQGLLGGPQAPVDAPGIIPPNPTPPGPSPARIINTSSEGVNPHPGNVYIDPNQGPPQNIPPPSSNSVPIGGTVNEGLNKPPGNVVIDPNTGPGPVNAPPPTPPPPPGGGGPPSWLNSGGSLGSMMDAGLLASKQSLPGLLGRNSVPGQYGSSPFYGNIPWGMSPFDIGTLMRQQGYRSLNQPPVPWKPPGPLPPPPVGGGETG